MSLRCFGAQQAKLDEVQTLKAELELKQECIQRQDEELRVLHGHIADLEGIATLKSAVESLTASVQQQELQHLAAADAQQRQLHAFNMALLEQAEELAALQALLGAPSRERQFSRRRVTEDLVDSLSSQAVFAMKDNTHVVPLTESLPSDEDLSREIVNVLSGVDVFQFNIDMLMQCLNAMYQVDLTDKKPFIKTIAIQYCMEHASDNAGEGEDESRWWQTSS
ncbi:hypothetical protein ABBQ32_007998 [Trebouxia sp. C0010 RCD-2024]